MKRTFLFIIAAVLFVACDKQNQDEEGQVDGIPPVGVTVSEPRTYYELNQSYDISFTTNVQSYIEDVTIYEYYTEDGKWMAKEYSEELVNFENPYASYDWEKVQYPLENTFRSCKITQKSETEYTLHLDSYDRYCVYILRFWGKNRIPTDYSFNYGISHDDLQSIIEQL